MAPTLVERYEARGLEPPAHMFRPEIIPGAEVFIDAFWDLCEDRAIGFGAVGGITFSAIDRYGYRFGFEGEAFDDLFFFVKRIDLKWRELTKKRNPEDKTEGQQ